MSNRFRKLTFVSSTRIVPNGLVLFCCFLFFVAGCKRNEVEPIVQTKANISFSVSWNYIEKGVNVPESFVLWLYPRADGASPVSIEIATGQAATLDLEQGVYDMIGYNASSLKKIQLFNQDSFNEHFGLMPDVSVDGQGSVFIDQADYLHALGGSSARILDVKAGVPLNVTLNPSTITKRYQVSLAVTSNVEILDGQCNLRGVKRKIMFNNTSVMAEGRASITFPLTLANTAKNGSSSGMFAGAAYILGIETKNEGSVERNVLTVKLNYVDTTKPPMEAEFDITNAVNENPNVNLDISAQIEVVNEKPEIKGITVKPYEYINGGEIVIEPKNR